MAGWLDDLIGQGGGAVPGGGFPLLPQEQFDEQQQAEEARQAAAAILKRQKRAPGAAPSMAAESPVPYSMGMLSPYGVNFPASPAAEPAPEAADMPPSTNDPLSKEPVLFKDGVPLPRPKPPGVGDGPSPMSLAPPDEAAGGALPPNATPTVGGAGQAAAAAPAGGGLGGILGKLFSPANAPMLLALGGGFSGAPSFGTGMRRAFSAAAPQAALLRKEQVLQGSQTATMQALRAKGVPEAEIAAAVLNPDIMKGTISKYFETKAPVIHDIKDALGGSTPAVFDPNTKKWTDMAGRPIGAPGEAGGAGGTAALLAPGVTFDPNKSGEEYLGQFSKEVQSAVKAYINGDVLPSGNPRQQAIASQAKTIAQRYGADMGIPVSDALFAEKRKYRTELGSTGASTAGGQAKAFNQGIEHADALATKLEKLGNRDPLGIPSVAHGINYLREAFSTKQTGLADEAKALGQTLAGEVGKLFSGSAGGGVHERELTRDRFKTIASPAELAGALEGTIETMEGGLKALEQRRDSVLGPNSDVNFVTKETQGKIDRIKEVIARLKGGSAPEVAGAAAPTLQPGQSTVVNGVTIKRLN